MFYFIYIMAMTSLVNQITNQVSLSQRRANNSDELTRYFYCVSSSPELCQVQHMTDLNQAYLKVISYGADIIVLADCLARYPQLDQDFRLNDLHQYGMYYNATNIFNPYHHAGYEAVFPKVNSAWERAINSPIDGGSPLTHPKPNSKMYFLSDFGRVSFRQGFRLGEDICACKDASSFDPKGEELLDNPVVVGDNNLVHLGTGPSVALPDAFYWLFAPRGLSGDALQSFRTFWLHALKKAGLIHTGYFQTNALLASPGGDSSKSLNHCVDMKNPRRSINMTSSNISGSPFSVTIRAAFRCVQHTSCISYMNETACATHLSVEVLRCLTTAGPGEIYIQDHIMALTAWFTELRTLKAPLHQPRPLRMSEQIKNTFQVRIRLYHYFKHCIVKLICVLNCLSLNLVFQPYVHNGLYLSRLKSIKNNYDNTNNYDTNDSNFQ